MRFTDAAKWIIDKFRTMGKTESDILNIIEKAADKETVCKRDLIKDEFTESLKNNKESFGEELKKAFLTVGTTTEKLKQAISELNHSIRRTKRENTNNWRKMHGMPMRRKGK